MFTEILPDVVHFEMAIHHRIIVELTRLIHRVLREFQKNNKTNYHFFFFSSGFPTKQKKIQGIFTGRHYWWSIFSSRQRGSDPSFNVSYFICPPNPTFVMWKTTIINTYIIIHFNPLVGITIREEERKPQVLPVSPTLYVKLCSTSQNVC